MRAHTLKRYIHDELVAYVVRKTHVALYTGYVYRDSTESSIKYHPKYVVETVRLCNILTDHDFVHIRG